MSKSRLLLLVVIVGGLIATLLAFHSGEIFSLANLKAQQAALAGYRAGHPLSTAAAFFPVDVGVTAISLPGAAIMTLAAGAIFGVLWGTIIVSFASSIGATLAFLSSRFVLRGAVQAKFGDKLKGVNAEIEKDGALYLISLRLVPEFPFYVINLLMGLTPIASRTFYWASQLGMFTATLVYVNAGTRLAEIDSLRDIASPGLLISLTLLGIFPLIAAKIVEAIKARRIYSRWPKPRRFDTNLLVIGAGSAGLVSAYIAAAVRAKVTLVEKHRMGGDCLNTGCVPSKGLSRSAKLLSRIARARDYGLDKIPADFDFAAVME